VAPERAFRYAADGHPTQRGLAHNETGNARIDIAAVKENVQGGGL
jgi:hypothetical protein